MDRTSETQEIPAVPLQYANRTEAGDALRVYRLVGTALLIYYCGVIAGATVAAVGSYRLGFATRANYMQQGMTVLLAAVGLAGAVCMTLQLRAGGWLVAGVAALQVGMQCLYFLLTAVSMRSARPGLFLVSVGSVTTSMLQSTAIALLAYLLWDHCRKRGAWG